MTRQKYFMIAFEAIGLNKLRASLTMLGMVIGVFSVIVMIGLGEGSQAYITQQVQGLGAAVVFVMPGNPRAQRAFGGPPGSTSASLTLNDAKALENIPGTLAVTPMAGAQSVLKFGRTSVAASITGSSANIQEVRGLRVEQGRFFSEQEERVGARVIVLGPKLADELLDKSVLPILGAQIAIDNQRFRVVGVLTKGGGGAFGNGDEGAFVPIRALQVLVHNGDRVSTVFLKATSEDLLPAISAQIGAILRQRHGLRPDADDDFKLQTQADLLQTVTLVTGAFTVLLAGIAAISLIVGGIGIMNIMLVTVTERTREIGIRKAVGARQVDILIQFLIESGTISLTGGSVGILLGVGVTWIVTHFAELPFVASPLAIGGAFLFSAAVGIFFGLYPAAKAARLDPVDALRYE